VKYFVSLLIYRILSFLLLPVLFVTLVLRSINHPEYRQRFLERLGLLSQRTFTGGIVVHAASVGEVIALKTFIEQLLQDYPTLPITITTFTPTGSAQVEKLFGDSVQHYYLPLDIFCCTWLFLKTLKPKAMVFMETELWPNLIKQAKSHQVKLLLINGRLSEKSMKGYQKLAWLITPTLNNFNKILSQSQDNKQNFLTLGAEAIRCDVSGNIKFDISLTPKIVKQSEALRTFVEGERLLWVMASTHEGDEALALKAFNQLKILFPNLLLVIVPRHPERFDTVASLCSVQGYSIARRSDAVEVTASDAIWLIDSLGELMAIYGLASAVTIGGSFSHIGGHNPLEPALFKKAIIVGPNMSNFTKIQQQLLEEEGVLQLDNIQSITLVTAVEKILKDEMLQKQLGEQANRVVLANQGASERSLHQLHKLLRD
jgi:3-deoxy-D-manno-octulosonic-acid transferase